MTHSTAFHIGAHKTATTHLQTSLQAARDAIRAEGVSLHGPAQLRGKGRTLAARFGLPYAKYPPEHPMPPAAVLAELLDGADRLVLTEENFVGPLSRKGRKLSQPLYKRAGERLALLAPLVAPAGLDLFLGIRRPTNFLNSVYGQVVLSGHVIWPKHFFAETPVGAVDWVGLVDRLLAVPGVRSLTVWRHEDYGTLFPAICAALLGPEAARHVTPAEGRPHAGLSAAAVRARMKKPAPGTLRPEIRELRRALPAGPDHAAFDWFDAETHAEAQVLYDLQCEAIASRPGVTLLGGHGPS